MDRYTKLNVSVQKYLEDYIKEELVWTKNCKYEDPFNEPDELSDYFDYIHKYKFSCDDDVLKFFHDNDLHMLDYISMCKELKNKYGDSVKVYSMWHSMNKYLHFYINTFTDDLFEFYLNCENCDE